MTPRHPVRALLTPRMLALHALVLALVAVLAWLGSWQLDRLGEARERSSAQLERLEAAPAPVGALLGGLTLDDTARLDELEFRPVTATGTWRPGEEVLQRGRSHQGRAGFHVLTPLDLATGGTVLVRRGWVPFDNELVPPVAEAAPPQGTVTVRGYLEPSIPQPTGPVAQRDRDDGELDIVFNSDLARLAPQLGGDVLPMLVHLESQDPTPGAELPIPAPRPPADDGPHLSYAVQWFSFAVIAVAMYGVWLHRRVRGDERALSREAAVRTGPEAR